MLPRLAKSDMFCIWLQDLDLVKLTAQFVARNGKGFLTDLAMKETRNQDFNFLKPTHSMFTFFTALCDSYSKVLMPPAGTSNKLRRDATDRCAAPVGRLCHHAPSACTSHHRAMHIMRSCC